MHLWVTSMDLTPAAIWHFYDGRAGMEPRICELREDFGLRKIPTSSFLANFTWKSFGSLTTWSRRFNATAWRNLEESWRNLTLEKLRYKLFLLPGELTRPRNRPVLRLRESPILRDTTRDILNKVHRLKSLKP
jgi:hypothetical protein